MVTEKNIDQLADDYADSYEWATDVVFGYIPSDWERALIADALHGFIAEHWK